MSRNRLFKVVNSEQTSYYISESLEDLQLDFPNQKITEASAEEERAYIAGYEDGFETSTMQQTLMDAE